MERSRNSKMQYNRDDQLQQVQSSIFGPLFCSNIIYYFQIHLYLRLVTSCSTFVNVLWQSHLISVISCSCSASLVPKFVVNNPDLYRLLTFYIPNLKPIFHCLVCTEESVRFRGFCDCFVTWLKFYVEKTRWNTTPCRLSATVYSVLSQLSCIAKSRSSIRNLTTRHAVVTASH
jgi:hypothetical protein